VTNNLLRTRQSNGFLNISEKTVGISEELGMNGRASVKLKLWKYEQGEGSIHISMERLVLGPTTT
jgi:hypothetical protein